MRLATDTNRNKFFTLIELLVVIAVIAIMLTLLLPALRTARERGRQVACLGNMKQLMVAFQLYADDYDGHSGFLYLWTWHVGPVAGEMWYDSIPPYMGCDVADEAKGEAIRCPSAPGDWFTSGGYSYSQPRPWVNRTYHVPKAEVLSGDTKPWFGGAVPLRRIKKPSAVMAYGECKSWKTGYNGIFVYGGGTGHDTWMPDMHLTGSNAGFVDGHAKFLTTKYLLSELSKDGGGMVDGDESTLFNDYPE